MSAPEVSVIIPAFNVSPYIRRCVSSALDQENVTVEIIVIDDCSTDSTVEELLKIEDTRLTVVQLERNFGPSYARNVGLDKAKGEWIAILDGDDAFSSSRLRNLISFAREMKADIVVDNLKVLDNESSSQLCMFEEVTFNGLKKLDLDALMESGLTKKYPFSYLKPVISANLIKKTRTRYDHQLMVGEDYLFFAELLINGAYCVVYPSAGYFYTRRSDSISYRVSADKWNNMIITEEKFKAKYGLSDNQLKIQSARLRFMNKMKNYERSVEYFKNRNFINFLKILFCHPLILFSYREALLKRATRLSLNRIFRG